MITNYKKGDLVRLKKCHPCASRSYVFEIIELGAICKIRCHSCNHDIILTRDKLNQSIVKIETDK